MDQLVGFIIFAAIAIGSWVLKAREQRQEAERRRQRADQADTQEVDLPEATRRMLYGDEAVPTARPKRDHHETGESEDEEGWRPVAPPPRPQPQPVRREEPRRQPVQQQRPQQAQPASPRRGLQDLWQEAQRRIEEELERQQQPLPQAAPAPRPPAIPKQVRRPETHLQRYTREEEQALERRRKEERQRHKREAALAVQWELDRAARRKASLMHMLTNLEDVRRGVVMQEVLGPPKALRSE
jgi:hypothetical protein